MKMVHKIILGNVLVILFIAMGYAFSSQKFDLLQNKLNFVEVADSLNATLLMMRLSEKNYFLYKDASDLPLIRTDLAKSVTALNDEKKDMIRAIGEANFNALESSLNGYEQEIAKLEEAGVYTEEMQASLREAGRELREQSASMVRLEREQANNLITDSRKALLYFFSFILLIALTSTYFFFSKMFRSLRRIEKAANSISRGNFKKIKGKISKDEMGSVMAAINSMCEELGTRHEQLIQSRKLASMGVLTAGVAHELGNPLNNISMVAQNFIELYPHLPEAERLEYMNTVLQECERIRIIVQNLLDFSKPKTADFSMADINGLIRHACKLVQNMLDVSCIECRLTLGENLPLLLMDRNKIEEVLINLFTNAMHAMTCGGFVSITTSLDEKGDYVIIEVADNGSGISEEYLPQIFDPFFSTKGTEGTGLGLSISYSIIKNHNGKIDVKSREGGGTIFVISLPVSKEREGTDERLPNHGDR